MNLSKRQLLILAGVIFVLLLLVVAIIVGRKSLTGGAVVIKVWGVFDNERDYEEIFRAFKRQYGAGVKFYQKDITTYEKDLLDALAAGSGPDVFMINNAWLPRFKEKLTPAQPSQFSPQIIKDFYPQVVESDFVLDNKVWAVPLSVDTLALFYNRDLLDSAGIPFPPTTWEEVEKITPRLTKIGPGGIIEQSAISMGTAYNINRASDILAALMFQSGSPIVDRSELQAVFNRVTSGSYSPGYYALKFYLRFSNPSDVLYTWNTEQHYSIDAFSEGTLAMMLNYSYHIPTIRKKGPFINFSVAPMPQPKDRTQRVDYANYWGFAVSKQSKHKDLSWKFISFITERENAQKYMRKSGRPPARRDLIQEVINEPALGVFAKQALTARSWFQGDSNEAEDILNSMIEAVRRGQISVEDALVRASDQMNLMLSRFSNRRY
jgi:ABC-type glycerol-3-phosphate transport system substrate-binding protein